MQSEGSDNVKFTVVVANGLDDSEGVVLRDVDAEDVLDLLDLPRSWVRSRALFERKENLPLIFDLK